MVSHQKSESQDHDTESHDKPVSPEVNVIRGKRKADEAETEDEGDEA